jgi:hypothetical protein
VGSGCGLGGIGCELGGTEGGRGRSRNMTCQTMFNVHT